MIPFVIFRDRMHSNDSLLVTFVLAVERTGQLHTESKLQKLLDYRARRRAVIVSLTRTTPRLQVSFSEMQKTAMS